MANGKLTERQQRFIDEYLKSGNASAAARAAGYRGDADTVGPRLLVNVGVRSAIAERQKELRERAGVTQQRIIEGLLAEAQYNGEGASHGARVAAWAHLARILGMFTEKYEIAGSAPERPTIIQPKNRSYAGVGRVGGGVGSGLWLTILSQM